MIRSKSLALADLAPDLVEELAAMRASGCKAEIEALYELTGLSGFTPALLQEMEALLEGASQPQHSQPGDTSALEHAELAESGGSAPELHSQAMPPDLGV